MSFSTHSQLHINPIARVFMVSESFFWSGWSILVPLISVFALAQISQATVQNISFAYSAYLLLRVAGSILCGMALNKMPIRRKIRTIICGIILINVAYLGFVGITSVMGMYLLYAMAGFFTGLISPLRATLFSTNLDKKRETTEWGLLDAIVLTTIAIAAGISGYLVTNYGYKSVFLFSSLLNSVSVIPYLFLLRRKK